MNSENIDRRESQRKKIEVSIRYRYAQKSQQTYLTAILFDISESGVSFHTKKQLQIADLLWIQIDVPEKKLLRKIQHNIVESNSEYLARVVRVQTDVNVNSFLISCCFLPNTTSSDELKVY